MMQVDSRTSRCNEDRTSSEASTSLNEQKEPAESSTSTSQFVNHAAIAWEENRRKWIGESSQRSHQMQKDQIISWSLAYEELFLNNDPFPKPIPLSEMVDYLVDFWHVEDLFD